ncbi:MAG: hypothetical protein GY906_39075 [bacterium]|nr:hypothetical protein [bacterium]
MKVEGDSVEKQWARARRLGTQAANSGREVYVAYIDPIDDEMIVEPYTEYKRKMIARRFHSWPFPRRMDVERFRPEKLADR